MRHAAVCLGLLLLAGGSPLAQSSEGFVPLFDGTTLNGWVLQNESKNYTIANGILTVHGTGGATRCTGDLYSEKQYGDFTMRVELRLADSDGGLFFRVPPPLTHDVGLQFQLRDMTKSMDIRASPRLVPWMGNLMRLGAATPQGSTVFDNQAAIKAYKPSGEWQSLELTVIGTHAAAKVNGISVMGAEGITPATGHFVIQCEQGDTDFRSILIKEEHAG